MSLITCSAGRNPRSPAAVSITSIASLQSRSASGGMSTPPESTHRANRAPDLPRREGVAMLCLQCGAERLSASPLSPPANAPTGAYMKLSMSYKHVDAHEAVEKQNQRHIQKLSRLLKSYEPDLVQLHGVISKNPHNQEHWFSLNLSLPVGKERFSENECSWLCGFFEKTPW